jgi:hypothetical protein
MSTYDFNINTYHIETTEMYYEEGDHTFRYSRSSPNFSIVPRNPGRFIKKKGISLISNFNNPWTIITKFIVQGILLFCNRLFSTQSLLTCFCRREQKPTKQCDPIIIISVFSRWSRAATCNPSWGQLAQNFQSDCAVSWRVSCKINERYISKRNRVFVETLSKKIPFNCSLFNIQNF